MRTPEDTYKFLDDMALNAFNWQFERRKSSKIHNISTQTALAAQVEALQRQLAKMDASKMHQHMVICEFYGGEHDSMDCQVSASFEQINFMGNFQRGKIFFKGQVKINSK